MSMKNRTMPSNIIIPVLHYINLDQAIDWLCKCFGFKQRWRVGNHRAELSYAGGTIAVTEMSDKSKGDFNLQQHSILARVGNVNKHFENLHLTVLKLFKRHLTYHLVNDSIRFGILVDIFGHSQNQLKMLFPKIGEEHRLI